MENNLGENTTTAEQVVPATTPETVETKVIPETPEAPQNTETPGSEPEKEQKVVRELKEQRRKRQEAERVILERDLALARQEAKTAYFQGIAEGKGYKAPVQSQSQEEQPPAVPDIANFETLEDFEKARDKYIDDLVDYKIIKKQKTVEVQKKAEQEQKSYAEINQSFANKIREAADIDPDIETKRDEVGMLISTNMGIAIKQSEYAPELISFLHANKAEIDRINKLSPIAQIRELVKIENKLNAPATTTTKTITQAPNPIKTVNTTTGTVMSVDEDNMSTEDWMKKERERRKGK
jgi:hypothetical protein